MGSILCSSWCSSSSTRQFSGRLTLTSGDRENGTMLGMVGNVVQLLKHPSVVHQQSLWTGDMRGISQGWNSGRQIFRLEMLRLDWLGLPNVRTTHATEGHEPGFFQDQHEPRSGWYTVGSYHSRIRKEPFKLPNESMCITIPIFSLQILISTW